MVNTPQPESSSKAGKFILQLVLILLVIILGLFYLKSAILTQYASTRGIYSEFLSRFQSNPDVLADLAFQEHHTYRDYSKALHLYKRALENFVLHAPSWLGLTKTLNDLDKKKQAAATLKAINTIPLNSTALMWTKAQLAHELNEGEILLSSLVWLADNDKVQRTRVFNLVNQTWDDPLFLMKNFKITHYPDLLQMYIRSNQLHKAQTVWKKIEENNINYPKVTSNYVNYLLGLNEFDKAADAWTYTFRRDGSLLYNGKFGDPILDAGFGWRVSGSDSTTVEPADLDRGLTTFFDGTENVAFRLAQTVPIYPGEHVFKGTFETDSLTSEQLPFWKITGYNCAGLFIEDLMVPPSEHLTEFEIPFNVPKGCKAIEIALVRNRASNYDSLISGNITVHNLDILRISPLPVLPPKTEDIEEAGQSVSKSEIEPMVEPEIEDEVVPEVRQADKPVADMSFEKSSEAEVDTKGMPPEKAPKTKITINRIEIHP